MDKADEKYMRSLMQSSGKRILDIGCGPGRWSYQAADYGAKSIDGFDIRTRRYGENSKASCCIIL